MTRASDSEEDQNSGVQSKTDFGLNSNSALAVRPLARIHFSLAISSSIPQVLNIYESMLTFDSITIIPDI